MSRRRSAPGTFIGAAALAVILGACGARAALEDPPSADEARVDAAPVDAAPVDARRPVPDAPADVGGPDAGPESDIGDPCGGPADCFSVSQVVDVPACIGPDVWPNGHLWDGGYCTAQCTPSSSPGEGEPLARDDCPHDALCVPLEGGIGVCLLACQDDSPCRMPGPTTYSCRLRFGAFDDPPLPIGVCMASHCQTRGCPGSAYCGC